MDSGYLRLESLVAQAPGTKRPATAGVSQALGAILTPAPVSTLQIGQAPNSSFLVSMYWQISGTGAHTPPGAQIRTRLAQDLIGPTQFSDLQRRLPDPGRLIGGGSRPQTTIDLGLVDPGP